MTPGNDLSCAVSCSFGYEPVKILEVVVKVPSDDNDGVDEVISYVLDFILDTFVSSCVVLRDVASYYERSKAFIRNLNR